MEEKTVEKKVEEKKGLSVHMCCLIAIGIACLTFLLCVATPFVFLYFFIKMVASWFKKEKKKKKVQDAQERITQIVNFYKPDYSVNDGNKKK